MGFVQFRNKVPVPVNERIKIRVSSHSFPKFTISGGTVIKFSFHFDIRIKHKIKLIVVVNLLKDIILKNESEIHDGRIVAI